MFMLCGTAPGLVVRSFLSLDFLLVITLIVGMCNSTKVDMCKRLLYDVEWNSS